MRNGVRRVLPLRGRVIDSVAADIATVYALKLLRTLGADPGPDYDPEPEPEHKLQCSDLHIAQDWADSGLIPLTGTPDFPMQGPAAIPCAARGAIAALKLLVPGCAGLDDLNGARLLSERAAFLGLRGQGQISANGSCRLLHAQDGWIALNLARDDDWVLLPAWLERPLKELNRGEVNWKEASWKAIAEHVAARPCTALVERGRLMGLPVAPAEASGEHVEPWFSIVTQVEPSNKSAGLPPVVVDLSSLWAGPLCAHLLTQSGCRVIKVESATRLDGARGGDPDFFDLLHANQESVVLDLSTAQGKRQLRSLIEQADIVVEGSRPRALQQLGIDASKLVSELPGLTWVSITGYGRTEPQANWVAFGDDAAVAAGVALATAEPPQFCGDALADPLAGMHAAIAALAFSQGGGGVLLDISLCTVASYCLDFYAGCAAGKVVQSEQGWRLELNGQSLEVISPRKRNPPGSAAPAGRDTQRILEEFHITC